MAAFILVSIDDELTELAESIKACCSSSSHVSLGSLRRSDKGLFYHTEKVQASMSVSPISLKDALGDHMAQFRTQNRLASDELINVFVLSSVHSAEACERHRWILETFDELFNNNNGQQILFRLIQIVLCYDVHQPLASMRVDREYLRECIERQKNNNNLGATNLMCLIGNRVLGAGSLCLSNDDHDLLMPRMLADFMMLASSSSQYDIFNAINTPEVNTSCFSMGWAEAMYYYPDVERYFVLADQCSLLEYCLSSDDMCEVEKDAMSVSKSPIGLRSRQKRLRAEYTTMPINESIKSFADSSDYRIDERLKKLKPLVDEYAAELQPDIDEKKQKEKKLHQLLADRRQLNEKISNAVEDEDTSYMKQASAALDKEVSDTLKRIEHLTQKLQGMVYYTDRDEICQGYKKRNDDEKEQYVKDETEHYNELIKFVCSPKFHDYVVNRIVQTPTPTQKPQSTTSQQSQRTGCLFGLFGRKHSLPQPVVSQPTQQSGTAEPDWIDVINEIKAECKAKNDYDKFCRQVGQLEEELRDRKERLKDFRLSSHCRSEVLIDLPQLRNEQSNTVAQRIEDCVRSCNSYCQRQHEQDPSNPLTPELKMLTEKMEEISKGYTQEQYLKLDWNNVFPFVNNCLPHINAPLLASNLKNCHNMSAPFVDYRVVGNAAANNCVVASYSDMPDFDKVQQHVSDGYGSANVTFFYHSGHIDSKICIFQFNPLTVAMLDNLVMLSE